MRVADLDEGGGPGGAPAGPPPLRLDPAARAAWLGERRIRLTATELAIVAALSEAPGGLDRAALLARVWNLRFDPGTNLVAVHVHRLRAKLGASRIAAGAGGGYRLCAMAVRAEE